MIQTEQQIAQQYLRATNKLECIKALAEANDCTMSEIKEILANQDVDIKATMMQATENVEHRGPGRPKGSPNKPKEEENKEELVIEQTIIPQSVLELVYARTQVIQCEMAELTMKLGKLKEEEQELSQFLLRETKRTM